MKAKGKKTKNNKNPEGTNLPSEANKPAKEKKEKDNIGLASHYSAGQKASATQKEP